MLHNAGQYYCWEKQGNIYREQAVEIPVPGFDFVSAVSPESIIMHTQAVEPIRAPCDIHLENVHLTDSYELECISSRI